MKKLLLCSALIFTSLAAYSEDIELYIGDAAQRTGNKPQVLIIFDNSGSMNSLESVDEPYDPNTVYPAVGSDNSLSDKFIYFTRGGIDGSSSLVPDSPSESRRFLDAINSCATARERLASVGFYTGHIREYAFQGNSGSWQEIPDNNGANIDVIDCEDDVNLVPANPEVNAGIKTNNGSVVDLPDGFPIDGEGSKQSPVYYTANANNSNVIWSGEVVTLYTDNYLRWANSETLEQVNRTRLEIAQDTVTDLIESAPSVDFGLQVFNYNHSGEFVRDGGRIVFGIQEMTAAARAELVNIIDLDIDGETNTPLCESLYEASRYFAGMSVDFGDNDSNYDGNTYRGNTPPRDTSIEDAGVYQSPFNSCTNEVYVIMITDGEPTRDLAANTYIQSLPDIGLPFNVNGTNNYLAALAGWMHTHDLHSTLPDVQSSTLFTIGFGQDAIDDAGALLREAAKLGGGQYYPAKDPSALLASLQSALTNILEVNTSFTAPSVASNNFDRTETLDSVYYAMFVPDHGARWQGNLKKLKVTDGQQVDRTGAGAIDDNGNISKNAKTFWSTDTNPDGNDVKKGGVAEMLRTKSTRVIVSDIGVNGALMLLTRTNAETSYGDEATLASELDTEIDDIDGMLNWAKGIDVDDEDNDSSTTDIRSDVFGDPLHSKPLVINYGGASNDQDIRIIVGTNAGVLHMFDDNGETVDENWSFMPKEFFSKIKALRENFTSSGKSYGIDSPAVSYLLDVNGDGSIDSTSGDKAWIFFGLRRGGSSYYAMDVSDPDTPKLLWHLDASSPGFSYLGQSWSQPKIGFSALNIENGTPKPVLFFAGGYDTTKDNLTVGADDTLGRAVYMVDAETGVLKWSLSPDATSATNTQFTEITDSVPSSLAILDSDSDGLTDRLYFGDTGGNFWRVDMPGNAPFSGTSPWTAFKLAELGGTTHATDRRFFSEPSIARTYISDTIETTSVDANGTSSTVVTKQERPYEAILIGSGDRSTPAANDTDDKFFMIKDANIVTTSFVASPTHPQLAIPAVILATDLYDYTNNPFGQALTAENLQTLEINVGNKKGWFMDFVGDGEKNTASAIVINGVAYFTSFTPAAVSADPDSCELSDGSGILYAVDLALGTTVYDWRTWEIAAGIPDTPSIIITKDPKAPQEPCEGDCPPVEEEAEVIATIKLLAGKIIPLGVSLETSRIYLYVTESN
ncbi:rRNA (guanine-N1)-methyltransferase [Colwellia sp. BRX8-4]|uniref:pilus assembly protein n=1 Tax=Colwellia sp. BRX8-4 TaxID=2759836 RepID=UPI0015F3B5B8|nr:PilC/PilY family type IV pilus protein [Colwellia sp. BRX8-4]MBA6362179.1 rRNA (guanine-N1)-methyltransferase [Colwellia sp. BRX8-8]MBA6373116.1 rRNA (guanine-N1)-methyltransferase [Colwellia sp. BRX8-4]